MEGRSALDLVNWHCSLDNKAASGQGNLTRSWTQCPATSCANKHITHMVKLLRYVADDICVPDG